MTYDEASNFCASHCGSTLSNNPEPGKEENFALILAKYSFIIDTDSDIWTGFHYDSTTFDWRWPDNTQYGTWSSSLTNGYCGKLVINTNSINMTAAPCTQRHRFFCKDCNGIINKYIILRNDIGITRNWDDAQSYCSNNLKTSLISIHSDDDYNAAKQLSSLDTSISTWFGLRGPKPTFNYDLSDGTEWDYGIQISPTGVLPWASNQPDGNNPDECGVFWAIRSYKWDDEGCNDINNFLCYVPSELCNNNGWWQYINGKNGNWTQLPSNNNKCVLKGNSNTITGEYIYAILDNVQYINKDVVIAELTFSIQNIFNINNDINGIGVLFDVKSIYNYWFVGVKLNMGYGPTLTIYQRVNGTKRNIFTKSINDNILSTTFNTYYTIIATFSTTTLSVKFNRFSINDTLIVNNIHSFNKAADGITADYSGYIGIAINNLEMNAKTLYVSGTSMDIRTFTELHIASFTNSPTPVPTINPTPSPTNDPTPSPTNNPIPSPTNNPTPSPTNDPTPSPTNNPIPSPTNNPTNFPSKLPTKYPTLSPITQNEVKDTTTSQPQIITKNKTASESDTELPLNLEVIHYYIIFGGIIICLLCVTIILLIKMCKKRNNMDIIKNTSIPGGGEETDNNTNNKKILEMQKLSSMTETVDINHTNHTIQDGKDKTYNNNGIELNKNDIVTRKSNGGEGRQSSSDSSDDELNEEMYIKMNNNGEIQTAGMLGAVTPIGTPNIYPQQNYSNHSFKL